LAEPPALSPSTMNSSDFAGSRSWQSASLPGSEEMSSAPLRRVSSDDHLGLGGMFLEPVLQRLVEHRLDHRPHLGRDKLVFRLR
jgi:hypothetical protein